MGYILSVYQHFQGWFSLNYYNDGTETKTRLAQISIQI